MEVLLGKIVEDIYDLHQPSMMFHKRRFPGKPGSSIFFRRAIYGYVYVTSNMKSIKTQCEPNPIQAISSWGALGKTSGKTAPIRFNSRAMLNTISLKCAK